MVKKTVKQTLKLFAEKRLSTVTGAWVFYFLTSVIPLVFLLITLFGVFGVDLTQDLVSRLPLEFRPAGESIIETAKRASKSATVLFIFTSSYSCVRLLNQMSKDGDYLYGQKAFFKRAFFRKIWAVISLAMLFVVFTCASILVAFGNRLFSFSSSMRGVEKLFTAIIIALSIIAISYLIILLLNIFISPFKLKLKDVALGGLISLFAIVLGTIGFALYVRIFNSYNAFYGSLAGIVVFLFWVYIIMTGMVVGVIVNAELYRKNNLQKY